MFAARTEGRNESAPLILAMITVRVVAVWD